MAKAEKHAAPAPVVVVTERPICAVCGQYDGEFVPVTKNAVAHTACASAHPDVIAKVKARA